MMGLPVYVVTRVNPRMILSVVSLSAPCQEKIEMKSGVKLMVGVYTYGSGSSKKGYQNVKGRYKMYF